MAMAIKGVPGVERLLVRQVGFREWQWRVELASGEAVGGKAATRDYALLAIRNCLSQHLASRRIQSGEWEEVTINEVVD